MLTTIKYILITALRDKLFIGLFIAMFIVFGLSVFLGSTALVEEDGAIDAYIGGSSRLVLAIGLIVFVCFHVRTAFDNKEIELLLSRPISRTSFVFSYWMGFAVIATIFVVCLSIAMFLFLNVSGYGLFYWSAGLLMESYLFIAFALFASLILRSAVSSVMLCFGFYVMCRMMGFFLYIVDQPHLFKGYFGDIIEKLLIFVSAILPRLDLYADSKWLIYNAVNDTSHHWFIWQTLIYVPFLLVMAVIDFKRKQF